MKFGYQLLINQHFFKYQQNIYTFCEDIDIGGFWFLVLVLRAQMIDWQTIDKQLAKIYCEAHREDQLTSGAIADSIGGSAVQEGPMCSRQHFPILTQPQSSD